jgi:hypothetical protein
LTDALDPSAAVAKGAQPRIIKEVSVVKGVLMMLFSQRGD